MKKTPWNELTEDQRKPYRKLWHIAFSSNPEDYGHAIYEGLDNEQLFKIPELNFKHVGNDIYDAECFFGTYRVFRVIMDGVYKYLWFNIEITEQEYCDSIEDGKAKCLKHYENEVMKTLIKV